MSCSCVNSIKCTQSQFEIGFNVINSSLCNSPAIKPVVNCN